jgi:hypothetical protein
MANIIVFPNQDGGVSVCYPSNEISIEEVLAKDCPEGSIIIDALDLPTENEYFDAWELVDGKVLVNQGKKQAIIDAKQAEIDAKESANGKLKALGLTDAEIQALKGVA